MMTIVRDSKTSMVKILPKTLENLTIKKVDARFQNCIILEMSDGSELIIDTEHKGNGIYGPVIYGWVK